MSGEYDYSLVEVVIIDPQTNALRLMQEVFARIRITKVQIFSSTDGVADTINSGSIDLLLVDADQPESPSFYLIRQIRNDPTSRHPFLCIIVTTWNPTAAVVTKAIDVGADALLIKPASPRRLYEIIQGFVEARKKFAVTTDYVGPDRRKAPRPGVNIPLLDVPNTLQLKATGQWSPGLEEELVEEGLQRLREQKLRRISFQIPFLVELALPGLRAITPEVASLEHLGRMSLLLNDLMRRFSPGEMDPRTDKCCQTLLEVVDRLRKSAGGSLIDEDLAQLLKMGYALLNEVYPNRSLDELRKDVSVAIAQYRKRA